MIHGTFDGYNNHHCRCAECKRAKAEYMRGYLRGYRETPKGKNKMNRDGHTKRARTKAAFIESVDPQVVYEMNGGRCGICEEFIDGEFHVDHIIPLSKGGLHCYANAQPAHPVCNLRKGATFVLD